VLVRSGSKFLCRGNRRKSRACPGASSGGQNTIAPTHDHAQCRARTGQLCEVWVCLFAHFDVHDGPQNSLLQMHRFNSWRKLGGPVCDNRRLVRQDLLDQIVWAEVIRLLEDPTLIHQELDRRLAVARSADPTKKREQGLQRELPVLRQRERSIRAELQAIADRR
jgi:hypothetical protein